MIRNQSKIVTVVQTLELRIDVRSSRSPEILEDSESTGSASNGTERITRRARHFGDMVHSQMFP
jgi:hypothetical protein